MTFAKGYLSKTKAQVSNIRTIGPLVYYFAISIYYSELENGNIELGVHIADVTHFVQPGSLSDIEAQSRSTTVYLADRRYDMLPGILSSNLCSLVSGVDR